MQIIICNSTYDYCQTVVCLVFKRILIFVPFESYLILRELKVSFLSNSVRDQCAK